MKTFFRSAVLAIGFYMALLAWSPAGQSVHAQSRSSECPRALRREPAKQTRKKKKMRNPGHTRSK